VAIDGENRYAIDRSVGQHVLAGLVAAHKLLPGWQAVISDAEHRIIVLSHQEDTLIGTALPEAQWRSVRPDGIFEFTDPDGRPSQEASARSEVSGWETAVWASNTLLEAPIRALWWTIALTTVLAFVLIIGLVSWLGQIVAHSVDQAARAAIALGKDSTVVLNRTPVAEVNTLIAELQGTAAKQHMAEDLLRKAKDRLQLALDSAQLGWWQYDPRRNVSLWDLRAQEILDVAKDEAPFEELVRRIHPDDREEFLAARRAALNPAHPKLFVYVFRVIRKDGKVRWVETHGLPHFKDAGPGRQLVSFGGAIQDVTERKEREEKERLLMREINHRAKNMLSVVDAIAHQTATRSPEDFVERFSERVQALSASQDLLVRNEWTGVDLADLVRAEVAHFADLIGSRIAMHGPKLRVNPASAQAVGLALHELSTNAGKYGALSTDTGRLDICWAVDGDTFVMNWTEREGPPVSAPGQRGFGTVVMQAMVERSVGGKVDLNYAPSGLTWRLTCPAANALGA
jgi:PAS domain S-box-containing protein